MGRYLHKLPNGRPVNREGFLLDAAHGRSVIHVGFTDHPLLDERIQTGTWLHSQLVEAASSLIGLDVDAEGVAWATERGYTAHAVDAADAKAVAALGLKRADLVVAAEVLEHVDAPGPFLKAMRQLGDTLIVTTPNGLRALSFLAPLSGHEVIHHDHVHVQTPTTLRALLERSGWEVERQLFYRLPAESLRGVGAKRAALGVASNTVSLATRVWPRPYWCDGLIAVAY